MIKTEAGGAALTAEGGDRGLWGGASWSAPASEGCQLGKRPSSLGSLVGIGAEGQPREIRLVGITRVTRLCSMEVTAEGSSGHPQKSPTKSHIWTPELCSSPFCPTSQHGPGEPEAEHWWKEDVEEAGENRGQPPFPQLPCCWDSWVCLEMGVRAGAWKGGRD